MSVEKKKVKLTNAQIEDIVADYLGVHPKYLLYEGAKIKVDSWSYEHDGLRFNGWKSAPKK